MNLRYAIGSGLSRMMHGALRSRALPLLRAVPVGLSWPYDVQRFAGRRELPHIIDAGANVGQTALSLRKYFRHSTIHAFEPVRSTYETLEQRVREFPEIRCVHAALGARAGRQVIALRADSELNTLRQTEALPVGATEEVEIQTLDEYCQAQGIPSVDILKLDVQGFELEVLRGSAGLLARNQIHFVYSEVTFRSDDPEMQEFGALNTFLCAHGFRLSAFYEPLRWGARKEFLGFCNVLFASERGQLDRAN